MGVKRALGFLLHLGGTIPGNNPFLLHVSVQSGLQVDVEVEEPEASENPTQSFDIHNINRRHTAFGRDDIFYII